jgi:hypothetical protein
MYLFLISYIVGLFKVENQIRNKSVVVYNAKFMENEIKDPTTFIISKKSVLANAAFTKNTDGISDVIMRTS